MCGFFAKKKQISQCISKHLTTLFSMPGMGSLVISTLNQPMSPPVLLLCDMLALAQF